MRLFGAKKGVRRARMGGGGAGRGVRRAGMGAASSRSPLRARRMGARAWWRGTRARRMPGVAPRRVVRARGMTRGEGRPGIRARRVGVRVSRRGIRARRAGTGAPYHLGCWAGSANAYVRNRWLRTWASFLWGRLAQNSSCRHPEIRRQAAKVTEVFSKKLAPWEKPPLGVAGRAQRRRRFRSERTLPASY